MPSRPALAVILSPDHDVYHSGYLISAAAASGAAFRVERGVSAHVPLIEAGGTVTAIDLLDSPENYHLPSLERCHLYLKRSYSADLVPEGSRGKVAPFGLNYSCRTPGALRAVASLVLFRGARPIGWRSFVKSPLPRDFEMPATAPTDPRILFHTRLWPANQMGPDDDPVQLNEFRVDLVRELKRAFGSRFAGGVIPSQETYAALGKAGIDPDLLVKTSHQRVDYARLSRGPAIGIYTQGLHGSNAFKVAEYLASSKCIVGENLAYDLPEPLGASHLVRNSIEGIVAECDHLLGNAAALDEIRRESWNYYQRNIRFDRLFTRLLRAHASVA
jgi:hypothetical protein